VAVTAFEGWTINRYGLRRHAGAIDWIGRTRWQPFGVNVPFSAVVSSAWFRAWALTRRFDVYHPTYYRPTRLVRARRLVVTVHDMIHEIFGPQYLGDRTAAHKRDAVAAADAVITVSHNTCNDLVRLLGVPRDRIVVIPLASSLVEVTAR